MKNNFMAFENGFFVFAQVFLAGCRCFLFVKKYFDVCLVYYMLAVFGDIAS